MRSGKVSSTLFPATSDEKEGFPASGNQHQKCSKEDSKLTRKKLAKKWPEIKTHLDYLSRNLSKGYLVRAITILAEARKGRFLRRRTPKYGSMNKGFTEDEIERFFSVIDEPKARLLFSYQVVLGLRIGEAVRVNIKDINLRTKELRIDTEKSGKVDYLLIPADLFSQTINYISTFEKEIAQARGFLFFSFTAGRRTECTSPYLTSHSARLIFQEYIKKSKLQEVYGHAMAPYPRSLYRLTPHSLRHFAITNFCKKNGGNVALSAKFARHSNLQTTMVYIHTRKEELYASIERAQDEGLLKRVREMQEKI